jgi:predicted transcriptional regulator
MGHEGPEALSRRERQIMEILYRLGRATAADVLESLDDAPSYSAVRSHLRILEEKGHVDHEQDGPRYVFRPTVPLEKARRSALNGLLHNFFEDSREQIVATLLDMDASRLDRDELDRLASLIDKARKEGR